MFLGLYCVRMNLYYTKLSPTCPQFHVVITFLCINSSPSEEILWRHSRTFWTGQLCASPSWGQSHTSLLLIEIKMKFIMSIIMFYMLTPAKTSTITATPTTPPSRELIWITSLIQQNICNLFVYFFPRRPEQAYFWNRYNKYELAFINVDKFSCFLNINCLFIFLNEFFRSF